MNYFIKLIAMLIIGSSMAACTSDEDGNSNAGAPASIIGCTLIETVQTAQVTGGVIAADSITYTFVDSNTILGAGAVTLPTSSWSYSLSGNIATVALIYVGLGSENITLTFSSATGGTFTQFSDLTGIGTANLTGSFTVSGTCAATSGTGSPAGDADGNGTIATADAAPSPAYVVDGVINSVSDGSDFTSFTGTGASFTATLSGYGSNDLDLYLYNSAGSQINVSDGITTTETISPGMLSTGATYYLEVRGYETGGANSAYHLEVVQ